MFRTLKTKSAGDANIVIPFMQPAIALIAICICCFWLSSVTANGASEKHVDVMVSLDHQTVVLTPKGHIHKEANGYKAELFSDPRVSASPGRNRLYTAYEGKKIKFEQLNVGSAYHIRITECINTPYNYVEFPDTSRLLRVTPLAPDAATYTGRAAVRKLLEDAAIKRAKKVTLYYPEDVPDFAFSKGSLLLDDEACSIAYTWYYVSKENDYGEQIRILGMPQYRYDYRFDYDYSAEKQKKYLEKAREITAKICGIERKNIYWQNNCGAQKSGYSKREAADKVKRLNKYLTDNCVYDDTLMKGDPYDAIVDGVAVCDGYSKAAYLILNMAGVPCEYVYGQGLGSLGWENHSWNIVGASDSLWYQCDFTWDSQLHDTSYFMKGSADELFAGRHVYDKKFKSKAWKKKHPMSVKDYPVD